MAANPELEAEGRGADRREPGAAVHEGHARDAAVRLLDAGGRRPRADGRRVRGDRRPAAARPAARGHRRDLRLADLPPALRQRRAGRRLRHRRGDVRVRRARRDARASSSPRRPRPATPELQQDPQQSPPLQIESSRALSLSRASAPPGSDGGGLLGGVLAHLEGGAAAAGGDDVRVVDRRSRRPGGRRRSRPRSRTRTACSTLSTTTETPWCSKTWSSSFGWSSASAYWKPEQPPPRTATRSACSAAVARAASSSLILPAALSVRLIGVVAVFHRFKLYRPVVDFLLVRVLPVQVLEDPPGVVDHLVAVDQHGHAPLAGQLLDLRATRPP